MPRRRAPWWVLACAVPFAAYFLLLVYCDVRRPESEGLSFARERGLVLRSVTPGSAGDRAGLRPGDTIVGVDGQPIGAHAGERVAVAKMDWVAVANNLEFDTPIQLDVLRNGQRLQVAVTLRRQDGSHWLSREGLDLLVVRLVQLVTLALGFLILFKRPHDPVARLGAWLLGSVGVFCIVLPFRIAAVWRGLWWPVGLVLWIPFISSLLLGALLLTFFLLFPVRRVRSTTLLAGLWMPALAAAAPFVRYQLAVVYSPERMLGFRDGFAVLLAVAALYLVATMVTAAWSYRHLAGETERRRLRVLLAGVVLGCSAAGAIVIGWWESGAVSLFGSTAMGWLVPLLLTIPLAFAYAILRHRLFDVRVIVRQGVQYALARRLLASLVPALLVAMVVDLYVHRDQPMGEVVAARATVYLLLSAAAVVAGFQRQRWLVALDRRFFRERYDAQRLLRRLADDIREAGSLERVAEPVVRQIELALHPRFVSLLLRSSGSESFRPLATAPVGAGPERLPAGGRLIAVAKLIGRPIEICTRDSGGLCDQLPAGEVQAVRGAGVDLLVPIATEHAGVDAFIALGPRRSEEPYGRDDQDLLQTIAGTLGLLLSQDAGQGLTASFRECPRCGACYDEAGETLTTQAAGETPALPGGTCAADGALLVPVRLPRVLVARYRLDHRLERGGMGTVYSAADLALQRTVAVKVLRDELVGHPDAVERFEREARTAAGFCHPNVVTIHDFGISGRGRGFLVMERLHGRTLRAEMEGAGALAPARVSQILRGVCSAVDAAHRRRLVHRDLKPENVFLAMVEGTEVPKVLDFGIAKSMPALVPDEGRQTAVGMLVGTPEYMSPEQLRGEEVNPSWDLWALGVLAFEMLTGRHPFAALVAGRTAPAFPAGHAALLGEALTPFDGRWSSFFTRALSIDPAHRPPTAGAFSSELEATLPHA